MFASASFNCFCALEAFSCSNSICCPRVTLSFFNSETVSSNFVALKKFSFCDFSDVFYLDNSSFKLFSILLLLSFTFLSSDLTWRSSFSFDTRSWSLEFNCAFSSFMVLSLWSNVLLNSSDFASVLFFYSFHSAKVASALSFTSFKDFSRVFLRFDSSSIWDACFLMVDWLKAFCSVDFAHWSVSSFIWLFSSNLTLLSSFVEHCFYSLKSLFRSDYRLFIVLSSSCNALSLDCYSAPKRSISLARFSFCSLSSELNWFSLLHSSSNLLSASNSFLRRVISLVSSLMVAFSLSIWDLSSLI